MRTLTDPRPIATSSIRGWSTLFQKMLLRSSSSPFFVNPRSNNNNKNTQSPNPNHPKMFSQFATTAESLTKASSLVLRIGTDAHLYDDPDDVSIGPLLDSRFDSEKVEALKRLLALIAQGADVANFFPQVVKNVASQSLEVKKLVYLYLLHYAEKRPNEALLSINCFQKDLSDTNPLVRAYALRAMAGIRLHVVASLVLVAIGKCARDPSPYVRKCAAHALTKLHDLHVEENTSTLEELVGVMLSDNSPGVVGAAAIAFKTICPNNLALIGNKFRRLCEILPDVEEWGQIVLIEILLRYVVARHGLVRESIMCSAQPDKESGDVPLIFNSTGGPGGGCVSEFQLNMLMYRYYVAGEEELISQSNCTNGDVDMLSNKQTTSQNEDVRILLQCTSPLLWSQNSAVVLAASGVHWIMAPKEEVKRIAKPLLFILRSSQSSKYVVLCNIQTFAKAVPSLFAPYFEDFFICSSDSYQVRDLKLEILSTIATDSSVQAIFDEFQDYTRDPDRRFVADTVAAIGLCAQRLPSVADICLEGLLTLVIQESPSRCPGQIDGETGVLVQAIMSIKGIIKQNPVCHEKIIVKLARKLDIIKEPAARALIVWIVGEYCSIGQIIPKVIPTVLQYLAHCFTLEEPDTKQQILNTTAKVVLSSQEEDPWMFKKILSYIIELAKHDVDYDIRDRARMFEKLVPCHTNSPGQEEGTSYLQSSGGIAGKIFREGMPQVSHLSKSCRFYLPGSLSHIVLHAAPGYGPLPKPCSVRDEELKIYSDMALRTGVPDDDIDDINSSDKDDPETSSRSSFEESGSNYDSEHSNVISVSSEANGNDHTGSLLSVGIAHSQTSQNAGESNSAYLSAGLADMMSKSALESWLDERSNSLSEPSSQQLSLARVSINDLRFIVKPKLHTLLDPANGNGLKVEYSFSSEVSIVSPLLVCVEVVFGNHSTEQLRNIFVRDGESDGSAESASAVVEKPESLTCATEVPTILPVEEVACLDPGQTAKKVLQVRFLHHLLPVKLAVFCNGKKHPTKLWPEIGYFMRPLPMNLESFADKESQLRGMFEYSKSCTFGDHIGELADECRSSIQDDKILIVSRCLASKILSNANLYLLSTDMPVSFNIDDASGLRLRFSGEILSSSLPCLITLLAEGKCTEPLNVTVKINCEETTFGLNLLNRLVAVLN